MTKSKREQKSTELAKQILENYQPKSKSMLKGEMNHHLGYEANDKTEKETENRRNGYGKKIIKTSSVEVDIKVP